MGEECFVVEAGWHQIVETVSTVMCSASGFEGVVRVNTISAYYASFAGKWFR